jgi:predicted HD phosphohydrolase
VQDLKAKMTALDAAANGPYCERWPALFDRPDMRFATMAVARPQSADAQATFMADYQALHVEAARLCELRAPGTGAAMTQALERWKSSHGGAKDKLMAAAHAQAQSRAEAVGGRILALEAIKPWQRARAIERQQRSMQALDAAAVRPYCEKLPLELERAEMDFNAQWQACERSVR